MDTRPGALYSAILADVKEYLPFGPVGLGSIPPDASYKQFASSYLVTSLLKKYKPSKHELADENAKEKFRASNKKCSDWRLPQMFEWEHEILGEIRDQLYHFFHPEGEVLVQSMFDLLEHARTGPGSAIGASGFSFYAKFFSSRLTTTSAVLYSLYRRYIEWFPDFDEADAICRRSLGYPRVTRYSRVSFAPKTTECSRMICVEPSLNMFFQLGLGQILEKRLKSFYHIDLALQPDLNRVLARYGSKTGRLATIDLSSASDSISIELCRQLLPSWVFDLLMLLRSPETQIDGKLETLNMISTMGNGFTFPLQTIIFSALIRAVYRVSDCSESWACFGDDLIVSTKVYTRVIRVLELLGFSVNRSKTFSEGPFRESCGTDWFYGQPVRPVFIKKLNSLQDIMVAINLLNEWTAYTGIPLIRGVSCLYSMIREPEKVFVPFDENMDAGIRHPSLYLPRSSYVWDKNGSRLYRPFRPIPKSIKVGDGKIRVPRGLKRLIFNPPGLELSFVFGELTNGTIAVRHDRISYRRKTRSSPNWDWVPPVKGPYGRPFTWQQWETAVLINLSNPLGN